jgi:hypothetical protein
MKKITWNMGRDVVPMWTMDSTGRMWRGAQRTGEGKGEESMDLVEFYIRHFILNILNMFAKLKAVKGTLTGLEKGFGSVYSILQIQLLN